MKILECTSEKHPGPGDENHINIRWLPEGISAAATKYLE